MKDRAKRRLQMASRKRLCVACMRPLAGSKVVRGCHEKCYRATIRAVSRGEFTEKERIADGKLLTSRTGGGKPTNPVTIEARSSAQNRSFQKGESTMPHANCFYGVDADMELNSHLGFVQSQIIRIQGISIDLEDILWYFFRTSNRDMSICTEIIVETANNSQLLEEFSKRITSEPLRSRHSGESGEAPPSA